MLVNQTRFVRKEPTMFEALIYDERDKSAVCPSSTLGYFKTPEEAQAAIEEYLTHGDMPIYKTEVVRIALAKRGIEPAI